MKRTQAYTLIECITYVAVLAIVLNLGFTAYFRCQLNAAHLRRNADDITSALRAGERWRTDIRKAVSSTRSTSGGLVIPQRDGDVTYEVADGTVWRQTTQSRIAILKQVKNSVMQTEVRGQVHAWRWELELATPQKAVQMRPLFTFEAAGEQQL
jgi:hypothetical protein